MLRKVAVAVSLLALALITSSVKGETEPFTYYPPGHFIKDSAAFQTSTGLLGYEVHAPDILFPIKQAPAFANSQVAREEAVTKIPTTGGLTRSTSITLGRIISAKNEVIASIQPNSVQVAGRTRVRIFALSQKVLAYMRLWQWIASCRFGGLTLVIWL